MARGEALTDGDQWRVFDSTDVALIVSALDQLDPGTLTPEARSRLIEMRSILIQRETGYYGA